MMLIGTSSAASSASSGRRKSFSTKRVLAVAAVGALALTARPVDAACEMLGETMDENTKMCRSKCHLVVTDESRDAVPKFWQWEE